MSGAVDVLNHFRIGPKIVEIRLLINFQVLSSLASIDAIGSSLLSPMANEMIQFFLIHFIVGLQPLI